MPVSHRLQSSLNIFCLDISTIILILARVAPYYQQFTLVPVFISFLVIFDLVTEQRVEEKIYPQFSADSGPSFDRLFADACNKMSILHKSLEGNHMLPLLLFHVPDSNVLLCLAGGNHSACCRFYCT